MSDQPGASNGKTPELPEKKPFPRLSSFKLPRDLSLGASAPPPSKVNKKVFLPNLNVVRNKNKTPTPNLRSNNKKEDKKREKTNNKSKFNGPSVVKSSGVFSEGIAASERVNSRASYSRDSEPAQTNLQKPVLRLKQYTKIDNEVEDLKIKKALGQSDLRSSSDDDDDDMGRQKDAPLRLPISAGGSMYTKKKVQPQVKPTDVVIKKEPLEEDMMLPQPDRKVSPEAAVSAFDATDVVRLLNSDKPKIMLLQLPDNLPGRGAEEEPAQKNSSTEEETKIADNRCKLADLEEGRIGKIQIYKSGKVKLLLGDTSFDISLGTQPCFRQDVVSVGVDDDGRTGTMINLGPVNHKLNVIPDWESLFKDVVI